MAHAQKLDAMRQGELLCSHDTSSLVDSDFGDINNPVDGSTIAGSTIAGSAIADSAKGPTPTATLQSFGGDNVLTAGCATAASTREWLRHVLHGDSQTTKARPMCVRMNTDDDYVRDGKIIGENDEQSDRSMDMGATLAARSSMEMLPVIISLFAEQHGYSAVELPDR